MAKLTVGEIAKRIQEPGEDLTVVVDRLRNWTGEGLLKTLDHNPGTGRKRLYPERALIDAAILSRLTRYFGVRAPQVSPLFSGVLDLVVRQVPKTKVASEADPAQIVYLIVGVMAETGKKPQVISNIQFVDDPWRSRRPKDGPPKRLIELSPFMSEVLLINLTSLFERLDVPLAEAEELKRLAKKFPGIGLVKRG